MFIAALTFCFLLGWFHPHREWFDRKDKKR